MRQAVLLDTGALVAMLKAEDAYHDWVVAELKQIASPLWTCEAVITEACFLLRNTPNGEASILQLLEAQLIQIRLELSQEGPAVRSLMDRYAMVPMTFADACLVRMSELHNSSPVLTLNPNFLVYRKHEKQAIPVILPPL